MALTDYIPHIITALSSGTLSAIAANKLANRKQTQSELEIVINNYRDRDIANSKTIDTLRERLDRLEQIQKEREIEINSLRNQLLIFESSHSDLPLPMWLKDTNGVMLFVNKEFEYTYLKPLGFTIHDYIGKKDADIFGQEFADKYAQSDAQVLRSKKAVRFSEPITTAGGATMTVESIKYPRFLSNTVIGIGGIALRNS